MKEKIRALLKKIYHGSVFCLRKVIFILAPGNHIVFESIPDCSDNTKAVFDEMVNRGANRNYKLVWFIYDQFKQFPKIDNVVYIDAHKKNLKYYWYYYTAKVLICCNRFLTSVDKRQHSFYLMHGTPIKKVKGYNYYCPEGIDYMITSGEGVNKMCSDQFNMPIEKCIPLGYPRNDVLYMKYDLSTVFGHYDKYIVWYPTVRQFKGSHESNIKCTIPLIDDVIKAKEINDAAERFNILVILKPHFAQDTSFISAQNMSNIKIIDDNYLKDKGISSYQLVGNSHALLTDYSSIYYDYLLCGKPVGLILEDIEEYKKKPGLIDEYEEYIDGGEKIFSVDELVSFLSRVSRDEDSKKENRAKICKIANASINPDNAKRVVDFIMNVMEEG